MAQRDGLACKAANAVELLGNHVVEMTLAAIAAGDKTRAFFGKVRTALPALFLA